MTWRKGQPATTGLARINRLTCDHKGYEQRDGEAVPIACTELITGFNTAAGARTFARRQGWETTHIGDRCPQHRVTRRRPT